MPTKPHRNSFSKCPLAFLALAFAVGIAAARYLPNNRPRSWLLTAAACFVAFIITLDTRHLCVARASAALTFLFLGASLLALETHHQDPRSLKHLLETGVIQSGDPVEIVGLVTSASQRAPDGTHLDLRVEHLTNNHSRREAIGVLLLTIGAEQPSQPEFSDFHYGMRLRFITQLNRTSKYRNPGVAPLEEFLDQKGYDAAAFIKSGAFVERLEFEQGLSLLAWLYDWRQALEQRNTAIFSAETAGVLNAALLGNRYGLSRETAERFREGGTFHVLVISGMHISFIGGVVLLVARRLTRNRFAQFALSTIALWSYTLAVGAEVSVTRAAFMFTFVALAPLTARSASSLNALGASALLLLVYRPSDLFDPSFQLTFLSVIAIVVMAWPIIERLSAIGRWRPTRETPRPPSTAPWLRELSEALFWSERSWREELAQSNQKYRLFKSPLAAVLERSHVQRLFRYSFCAIVISLSVQVVLLPLQIFYFHRVSFAAILLNINVSVLMGLMSLATIAAVALSLVSATMAAPLVAGVNTLNWMMVHSGDLFLWSGVSSIRLPEYSGWKMGVYACYYLPLIVLCALLRGWIPVAAFVAPPRLRALPPLLLLQGALILILTTHPFAAAGNAYGLRVDFLDVGQGDAALITMPDSTTILVDAGGRPNFFGHSKESDGFARDVRPIGDAVVSEFLWSRGLKQVDYILATHADADHIDGLNDVARNFSVRSALVARTPVPDLEYQKFSNTLRTQAIPTTVVGVEDTLHFAGVTATVLWPPPSSANDSASHNDASVVLRLQLGNSCVILTGDIERTGESLLLRAVPDLKCDVVKVAHHGSKTSSVPEFVRATQPRLAIISVGQKSMFGHPHREVVERWRGAGAEVMTTGRCGAITVTSDGKDVRVETFVPGCR